MQRKRSETRRGCSESAPQGCPESQPWQVYGTWCLRVRTSRGVSTRSNYHALEQGGSLGPRGEGASMRRRFTPATSADDMNVRPKRISIRAGQDKISRKGNSWTEIQSDSDAWLAIYSGQWRPGTQRVAGPRRCSRVGWQPSNIPPTVSGCPTVSGETPTMFGTLRRKSVQQGPKGSRPGGHDSSW